MRRVYRIFAHAWFQHRLVFWEVENNEGLYMLFKTVCDVYSLIPEENYTIPPEAEGLAAKEEEKREGKAVMRENEGEEAAKPDNDATTTISTGATTRRHKSTPSFSSSVTAIAEGDEDDSPVKEKSGGLENASSNNRAKEAPLAQTSKSTEDEGEDRVAVEANPIEQPAIDPTKPASSSEETNEDPRVDEDGGKSEQSAAEGTGSTAEPNLSAAADPETESKAEARET